MTDLPKLLRIKAGVIEMGERIAWGSDSALMREAADALEMAAPAVQGEPVGYARPHQLEALLSGKVCGITMEDKPDAHNRLTVPLYTAPQPAPAVQGDRLDGLPPMMKIEHHSPGIAIEKDIFGTVHIKVGDFDYIQIQYRYPHTDNARQLRHAMLIADALTGAAQQPAEQQPDDNADVLLDKQCREDVAAALGFIRGGNYAWSYLLQQIKDAVSAAQQQPAPDVPGLAEALRQYQHNDGSGLVFGYDKLLVDQYVAGLVEALERAHMALIGYLPGHRNDITDAAISQCEQVLAPYRKGGDES